MPLFDRWASIRALALIAAISATALTVAACGGDDDDGGDSESPNTIAINATGSERNVSFEAPAQAEAGAAEIQLTNSTNVKEMDGQLGFVAAGEEHSDEEVAAELQNAATGKPVAEWFLAGGGVGVTTPGETESVTQDLQEGTYYVLSQAAQPRPPLTKIEVSGGDGAELPETEGTVTAAEYSFTGEGLKAGTNQVLLDNAGAQWHHFLASELKPDATIEQAQQYLERQGRGVGRSPFTAEPGSENAVETTVLDGGFSQVVDVELNQGRYAFYCFISDKQGGPPHVAKGMVSEVVVEE
jgi:hypothetical protein